MKITQVLTTAILTLATFTCAQAFVPPYHIEVGAIPYSSTGTLKLKTNGGCKISQTFVGAQYGKILDDNNDFVAVGFITATGSEVIADYSGASLASGIFFTKQNTSTLKKNTKAFVSVTGTNLIDFLATNYSCPVGILKPAPNSSFNIAEVGPTVTKARLKAGFTGYTPYLSNCVVKGTTTTCKGKKITGSVLYTPITFL